MRPRRLILVTLATIIGTWIGGFHEWIHPNTAHASATCTNTTQFPETYAYEDINDTYFVGVGGTAQFACTSQWRVTFTPLYQDSHETIWHTGFVNDLYMPSLAGHYTAGQSVTFTPPTTPPDFTGYWTNGDGLNAARPVCEHWWRVRERFTNTANATTIATFYSPTITPTC